MTPKQLLKRIDRLKEIAARARSPLILIYGNPDPDALASAWALKELMRSVGITFRIGYTGELARLENRAMVSLLQVPAKQISSTDIAGADLIALVDAQPGFFRDVNLKACRIVFDHHPLEKENASEFTDIRPHCLATSSILATYLEAAGIELSRKLATALYYGFQTDAAHQRRWPSATDHEALRFIEKRVKLDLVKKIEFSSYSLRLLDFFSLALLRLRFAHGVVFSYMGPVPNADICVQVADFLTRVQEAKWALTAGITGDTLVIVFRCDGHNKHAGETAQAAFNALGSAGGHRDAARAEIPVTAFPEGVSVTAGEKVEKFIVSRLAAVDREFGPLLRTVKNYYRES